MRGGSGKGLKALQWFNRGVQFGCSALVLSIFSYFLATLASNGFETPTWVRAVEGISGFAALYTAVSMLVLCCVTGNPFISFVSMVLDVGFFGAFSYVASANRGGSGTCTGRVDTPFGSGEADHNVGGDNGSSALPNFQAACRLETACFAVAMIALFFFIFSAVTEFFLGRNRQRERRALMPSSEYTSGGGDSNAPATPATTNTGGGFLNFLRRNTTRRFRPAAHADPNYLPAHTHPDDVRESYATETTAVPAEDDLAMHSYSVAGNKYAAVSDDHVYDVDTSYRGAAPAARNSWEQGYRHPEQEYRQPEQDSRQPPQDYRRAEQGYQLSDQDYRQPDRLEGAMTVSPPTPSTARFPAGNYRYDESVYGGRH